MARIFIKTFGCTQNRSDSEIIAALLRNSGFRLVESPEQSDLVVINTCTVKGPTESNFFRYLQECKEAGKLVVVAGCLPASTPERITGFSAIGPGQLHSIVEVVEETLNGSIVTIIPDEGRNKLALPRIRRKDNIEIIPISSGCLGECSFCVVRLARGSLLSYPKKDIIGRVRQAVAEGASQIWLTSQDTGCYGRDNDDGYLLPNLLRDIVSVPGDYMIRLGMFNPEGVMEQLEGLINAFGSGKLFRFMHMPVQSGNNDVLRRMRRKYTVEAFWGIVERFRKKFPEITIATDIICGFPGETDTQFNDTIRLVRELRPDVVNRSKFWPRPKTDAAKMKNPVDGAKIKERSRFLQTECERASFERNLKWRGWKGWALAEEAGKDGTTLARNYCYKPMVIQGHVEPGKKVEVRVVRPTIYDLRCLTA